MSSLLPSIPLSLCGKKVNVLWTQQVCIVHTSSCMCIRVHSNMSSSLVSGQSHPSSPPPPPPSQTSNPFLTIPERVSSPTYGSGSTSPNIPPNPPTSPVEGLTVNYTVGPEGRRSPSGLNVHAPAFIPASFASFLKEREVTSAPTQAVMSTAGKELSSVEPPALASAAMSTNDRHISSAATCPSAVASTGSVDGRGHSSEEAGGQTPSSAVATCTKPQDTSLLQDLERTQPVAQPDTSPTAMSHRAATLDTASTHSTSTQSHSDQQGVGSEVTAPANMPEASEVARTSSCSSAGAGDSSLPAAASSHSTVITSTPAQTHRTHPSHTTLPHSAATGQTGQTTPTQPQSPPAPVTITTSPPSPAPAPQTPPTTLATPPTTPTSKPTPSTAPSTGELAILV